MTHINADNILFTFGIFAIVMIAYGQAIPSANVQSNMNTIFAAWPTLAQSVQPPPTCSPSDFLCIAQVGAAQATGFIAVPFLWMGALVFSFLNRIQAFGNLLTLVTFGSTGSLSTIPFGGLFLVALVVVVVIEAFRLFRGSPSGL